MYVFSYILYSIEDVHNGLKYVLYTKQYYYEEAESKCADDGGTLAMAKDTETFDVLMVMLKAYIAQGGTSYEAFLDGSKETEFDSWECVNAQGDCPATMPWKKGEPNDPRGQQCVAISARSAEGLIGKDCFLKRTAICQFAIDDEFIKTT